MSKELKVLILNPPSPPLIDVCRDWAGGFGTAFPTRRRTDYGHSGEPFFQPFLPYAAGVLSEGRYDYRILDGQRDRLNALQLLREVKKIEPDVVLSLLGLPSLKGDLKLLDSIKKYNPGIKIVGVGTSCRILKDHILLNSEIDFLIRSTYPYVSNLLDFLKALEREEKIGSVSGISYVREGRVMNNAEAPEKDLKDLPSPDYENLELRGYECFEDLDGNIYSYIPILGSKGCPYSCIYCPYPLGFGKNWAYRYPKEIVDEIEYLHTRGVKGFLFRDQSFLMNKKHATKICEEIIKRKLDIAWICEARADQISLEILKKMKIAGCKQIHYGVETGDPKIIKLAKPNIDLNTIKKAFLLTKEMGIYTMAHIILGWPEEDLKTLENTYRFVLDLAPHRVNWNLLTPYPGTKLYELAKQDNLILTMDWSKYTSNNVVMKTRWLNAEELEKLKVKFLRDYSKQRIPLIIKYAKRNPKFMINELKRSIKGYFV